MTRFPESRDNHAAEYKMTRREFNRENAAKYKARCRGCGCPLVIRGEKTKQLCLECQKEKK